ncbi:glycosyltransferase family 2 protein [Methylotenera mobilis]|uniref:Rhamnosyltransferase n=1 Tax=Methylotenera mobilis (strain JLW8 / ATCC BAA-1282 / DSM 17540) TaxID=583345 RepID=C6WVJ5_METML|nr:glycosyltransferase family 2 protein [Methylotenera mobilis]ACT47944.1 rhamnosyltransferase [Methylotenera mobilis JLW8]
MKLSQMSSLVGGVVVAYYPDAKVFSDTLNSALNEVDYLVVVNNSREPLHELCAEVNGLQITVIENKDNVGIAKALNLGIEYLIAKNCEYFLLLDQDSKVPKSMVSELIKAVNHLSDSTNQIAAVGPSYFNSRLDKNAPFIQFDNFSIKKINPDPMVPYVPVDFLITSGSLITLSAIKNIGVMEDGLFIDYVDTEWCLRAVAKGYKLYGLSTVKMEHSLGDDPVVFFNKKMPMHSPLRHYYIARNALHLMKRSYIPVNKKIIILISMLKTFFFYSLVPSNRFSHLKMMCSGFYDGVSNNYGRYDKLVKLKNNLSHEV